MNIFDAINQTMADQSGYGESYPTIPAEEVSDRLRESNEELVEINATILADDAIRVTEYAEASREFKASLESAGYTLDQIEANEVSDEAIKDAAIRGAYKVKGGISRAVQNIIKIVSNVFKFNSAVNADLNNMKNEIKEAKKKLEKVSINSEKEFKLHSYDAETCKNIVERILANKGKDSNVNSVISTLNSLKSVKKADEIIGALFVVLGSVSSILLRADNGESIVDIKAGDKQGFTKEGAEAFRDAIKDSDYLSDLKDFLRDKFSDKDDDEYTGASAKSHMMKELGKFENAAWLGSNRDGAKFAKLSKTLETVKTKLDANFNSKEAGNKSDDQIKAQEVLMIAVGALGQAVVLHRKGAAMAMKAVREELNRLVTETVKVYAGAKKVS